MIKFQQEGHLYTSVDPDDIKWLSVTKLISKLHEPFDMRTKAISSHNRKPTAKYSNKWYKVPVGEIEAAWKGETERSVELGHWYHDKREMDLLGNKKQDIYAANVVDGFKYARDQMLKEGIYPEHLMYLLSSQICGQSDYVEVFMGKVYIRDYKTSKEIKRNGFTNYKGTKMMYYPIDNLEDCDFIHYALQLSLYMYMILRHNPNLEPGTLTIEHIKFEEESRDKYDYPVYKKGENGEFIIREIEEIEVPYMRREVVHILEWLKQNKQTICNEDTVRSAA